MKKIRAVQIDLDAIVDPDSYEQSDANLGLLIERLVAEGLADEGGDDPAVVQAHAGPVGVEKC